MRVLDERWRELTRHVGLRRRFAVEMSRYTHCAPRRVIFCCVDLFACEQTPRRNRTEMLRARLTVFRRWMDGFGPGGGPLRTMSSFFNIDLAYYLFMAAMNASNLLDRGDVGCHGLVCCYPCMQPFANVFVSLKIPGRNPAKYLGLARTTDHGPLLGVYRALDFGIQEKMIVHIPGLSCIPIVCYRPCMIRYAFQGAVPS